MRRRPLLIAAGLLVVLPLVVLGVEVQMARTGPRLDDEEGFRPRSLRIGEPAAAETVVWLGDSTATGVGVDKVQSSMAHRVTAAVVGDAELTILARSGDQVHEVIEDQLPALSERSALGDAADWVFVSVGANDVTALTRRPTFRSRYRDLVAGILEASPDARVVLVGIPDMGTAPRLAVPLRQLAGLRAAQLDTEVEQVADELGVRHVDLADRTSGTFSSDPERYFSADDYHPSADGHGVWADAVVDAVTGR